MKRSLAALSLLLLMAGCVYGPEHLDLLYAQRDNWQREIDRVETSHGLKPRATSEIQTLSERSGEAEAAALRSAETVKTLEDAWFKSLSKDQQLEWRIHRDLIESGGTVEILHSFGGRSRYSTAPGSASAAEAAPVEREKRAPE